MISFDWAMKRLLRQKANFEVLEGFLSELLCRKIIIKNIGESEGNKTDKNDKWNKVDILVEADGKELVIIELQYDSENDYFQRMLYGVSKAVTEHIHEGDPYSAIRKVYSINIVYFDLGKGDDYVYHDKARKILALDKLTDNEKKQYWRNVEERRIRDSEINTALLEGETKGEARGVARGEAERTQLKAELKEKEEKEVELRIRIAELEQQLSKTPK